MKRVVLIGIIVFAVTCTLTTAALQLHGGDVTSKTPVTVKPVVHAQRPVSPPVHPNKERRPVAERKSCEDYYPEPEDAVNWTDCKVTYRSPCGGPDQCYCDSSERLLDYKCAQGTYSICQAEEKNGCQ
jgi:hypothetical protein